MAEGISSAALMIETFWLFFSCFFYQTKRALTADTGSFTDHFRADYLLHSQVLQARKEMLLS